MRLDGVEAGWRGKIRGIRGSWGQSLGVQSHATPVPSADAPEPFTSRGKRNTSNVQGTWQPKISLTEDGIVDQKSLVVESASSVSTVEANTAQTLRDHFRTTVT